MSGMIDHRCSNFSHGIVSQNCLAKMYSDLEMKIQLIFTGTFVQVHSIQDDDVLFCIVHDDMRVECNQMVCKRADIINVPESLWGPLFTVKKVARLPLVKDSKIAESIGNISIGHTVQVLGPDNSVICIANVTFRNSIARLGVGIYFGLHILRPRDCLSTIIEKVSLLEPGTKGFPRGCDLVVTVDRILPSNCSLSKDKLVWNHEKENEKQEVENLCCREDLGYGCFKETGCYIKDKLPKGNRRVQQRSHQDKNHSLKKVNNSDNPLEVGDEVIYLNDDTPEKGVVRWLGLLDNSLKVGVEFDNFTGNGKSNVEGLGEPFSTKHPHVFFFPPMALIKLSDYMNNSKEECFYKKNYNTSNTNVSVNKSVKVNNNNCINNNNEYNTTSDFCCGGQQQCSEEKIKKLRKASNTHHSIKHGEKSFDLNDSFPTTNKEEEASGKETFKGQMKTESQHNWKSFDSGKSCERKMSYRRNYNSIDNGMIQMETKNNFSNLNCSSQEIFDSNEIKSERVHSHCCPEPRLQKYSNGEDDFTFYKSSTSHSNEKNIKNFQDEDKWECPYSQLSNSEEHLRDHYELSGHSERDKMAAEELGKGSMVELSFKGESYFGVIRWIGTTSEKREDGLPILIAGVEMEEECSDFTDGTLNNKRYFQCNPKKGLFVPLSKCRKDSRFLEDSQKQNLSSKVNYGQIDCPVVEGTIPPINTKGNLELICGKNRGIQGHHNSCYLDATLFSMFAFTSVFDSLLYRPPTSNDIPQYNEVQRVLREEIVNPLRKNLYVRADRVMKLRTLLEKLSSISGLTSEEKDPEEFLNSLLAQILKAEPFLKLSSGQEAFHYQLFVEKDDRLTLPSVQLLFEQSFVTSDIKLKQVPSCLIIQMPRFGKSFKMYSRILPPQLLDITDIIENSPRQCTVCGKLAEYECKDCFGQQGIGNGLESISFCKACLDTAHNHHCRSSHNSRALTVPVEFYELQDHCIIPRLFMELFAVVCIETSHYVAFVKCGSGSDAPWCFFDSMADRKGEQNGYNIPEMVPCPDLPYWLSEEGVKILNEMQDDKQLPEHAKRLFSDAYMCMYQSPDLMMYR